MYQTQLCSILLCKLNAFEQDDLVNVKWSEKNPRTKSYIWTAKVLTVGREKYCQYWERDTLIQITYADGNRSFASYIPASDPDMTFHDDVNKILLKENYGSQGAKRKLALQASSQCSNKEVQKIANEILAFEDEISSAPQPITLLNPEDVSKTFSEIQEEAIEPDEPNCSAIGANQVSFFSDNLK